MYEKNPHRSETTTIVRKISRRFATKLLTVLAQMGIIFEGMIFKYINKIIPTL